MAHVADHLSVSALEQQDRSCTDVTAARHVQTIWLLAKGSSSHFGGKVGESEGPHQLGKGFGELFTLGRV